MAFTDQHGDFPGRYGRNIKAVGLRRLLNQGRDFSPSRSFPSSNQTSAWVSSNAIISGPSARHIPFVFQEGSDKDEDGCGRWHTPARKPGFLFPVQALSKVFRGKFMAALAVAHQDGNIGHDPQGQDGPWRERQRQLYQHDRVVYAKTPLGGPAQVLEYLSRYTHRTAISNERIRGVSEREVA